MSRTQGRDCALRVREISRRSLEHLQVLGHRLLGHRERLGELVHRRVTLSQALQDRAPGGVGQGREHQAQLVFDDWHATTLSTTGSLHNRIVVECGEGTDRR